MLNICGRGIAVLRQIIAVYSIGCTCESKQRKVNLNNEADDGMGAVGKREIKWQLFMNQN